MEINSVTSSLLNQAFLNQRFNVFEVEAAAVGTKLSDSPIAMMLLKMTNEDTARENIMKPIADSAQLPLH